MFQDAPQYAGKAVSYSLDPVCLEKSEVEFIEDTLTDVLKKVENFTTEAFKDNSILAQLGLPVNLQSIPTPLGLHIPFARFDILYEKNSLKILELNTDGTSGFNIVEWLGGAAQIKTDEDPNFNLSGRLLEALLAHKPDAKEIFLVDYPDIGTHWEQIDLLKRWKGRIPSHFADPKHRTWKPGSLFYRRILSWQLRAQPQLAQPFIGDWEEGKIHVIGGWSSDIGMSKVWPTFLNLKYTAKTLSLTKTLAKKITEEKDHWVLKGALSYSGKAVIKGNELQQNRWQAAVEQKVTETENGRPWIVQELLPLPLYKGKPLELGVYFLNGKPSGYMCRWGHNEILNDFSNEILRPLRIVD